jgi:hypothetical protein
VDNSSRIGGVLLCALYLSVVVILGQGGERFLENGKVVLIVTLPHGAQCTKNQIVSALRNLGEDVKVADVAIRMSMTPTTAKTRGKAEKPFAPTIEIKLQGEGGLTPDLIEVI